MKASAKNLAGRIPSFVSALCLSLLALAAGPAGGATSARTFAELEAAFAGGETRCALAADIACERPLAVAEGKALELDLNDHRLTVRCSNAIIVTKGSKLVLKNAGSSCFGSTHLQKGCILPDDDHADILSSISPIILCQDGSTLEMRRGFVGNCRQGDWSLHFGAAIHARGTARVSVIGTSVIRGNPAISAEGLAQVEVDGNGGSKDMYDVVITGNGSEGPTSVVPQRKYGTVFEITDGNPSFTLGNCVVDCRGNLFRSAEGASGSITINNGFYATYITPFLLSGRTSLTLVDGIFEQLDVCLKPIVMPCEDGDPTGTDARPSPASVSIRESFGFGLSCDPEDVARIIPAALLEDGQKVESRPLKAYANRWNGDRTDNANKINCRNNRLGVGVKSSPGSVEVQVPAAVAGLVYNGGVQTGVVARAGYTLTGSTGKDAGDYTATATLAPGCIWSDLSTAPKTVAWSIARAPATVKADDKHVVAGEPEPALTVSQEGTFGGDALTYDSLSRDPGTAAGTYAIRVAGQAVQGNYDVTFQNGVLTIEQRPTNPYEALKFAMAGFETGYSLTNDIDCLASEPLTVRPGKIFTLDLNNHWLKVRRSPAIVVTDGATLKIVNSGTGYIYVHLQKGCILPVGDAATGDRPLGTIVRCENGSALEMSGGFIGNCIYSPASPKGPWNSHLGAAIDAVGNARVSITGTAVLRGNPAIRAADAATVTVAGAGGTDDMSTVVISGNGSQATDSSKASYYGTAFEIASGNPVFAVGGCHLDVRGRLLRSAAGSTGSFTVSDGTYQSHLNPFELLGGTAVALTGGTFSDSNLGKVGRTSLVTRLVSSESSADASCVAGLGVSFFVSGTAAAAIATSNLAPNTQLDKVGDYYVVSDTARMRLLRTGLPLVEIWTETAGLGSRNEDGQPWFLPKSGTVTINGKQVDYNRPYPEPYYTVRSGDRGRGEGGGGITYATKIPSRMTMTVLDADQVTEREVYSSGSYVKKESGLTIKVRGNTSAFSALQYNMKCAYKLKLQKKADLLLRGNDKVFKNKDWVLLASAYTLNTTYGFWLGELVGVGWTPAYRYVNVSVDGGYRGLYMLIESITRDNDNRIGLADDGYLFEYDPYWWLEADHVYTDACDDYARWTFKYPDPEDYTAEEREAWKAPFKAIAERMDASCVDGTYTETIDVDSWASWLMMQDLIGNEDVTGSNQYFARWSVADGGRIYRPCVWDFDWVWKSDSCWSAIHLRKYSSTKGQTGQGPDARFDAMIHGPNKAFNAAYLVRWESVKDTLAASIAAKFEEMRTSGLIAAIDVSRQADWALWSQYQVKDPGNRFLARYVNPADEVATMNAWTVNRVKAINANIGSEMKVDDAALISEARERLAAVNGVTAAIGRDPAGGALTAKVCSLIDQGKATGPDLTAYVGKAVNEQGASAADLVDGCILASMNLGVSHPVTAETTAELTEATYDPSTGFSFKLALTPKKGEPETVRTTAEKIAPYISGTDDLERGWGAVDPNRVTSDTATGLITVGPRKNASRDFLRAVIPCD